MRLLLILIFGLVGFVVGDLIGALLAMLITWSFQRSRDKRSKRRRERADEPLGNRGDWDKEEPTHAPSDSLDISSVAFETLFQVSGYIAKSDGHVSPREISIAEATMRKMQLDPETRKEAIALFREGADPSFDIDSCLTRIRLSFDRKREVGEILFRVLLELARADGINAVKANVLRDYADAFSLDPDTVEDLLSVRRENRRRTRQREREPRQREREPRQQEREPRQPRQETGGKLVAAYQRLGIAASASDDEVKRAYHNLIREYHPDRLVSKGLPKALLDQANIMTREAQEAWEFVRASRNIR